MKICVINNLYPPYHRGGTEIVAENQVKKFLAQRDDVFIISAKPSVGTGHCPVLVDKTKDLRIYRFYPLNIFSFYHLNKFPLVLRALWRFFDTFNLHSYFKIKHILKKEKPNVIYVHNLTGLGLLLPRLIKKLKIKYIQTMHDVVGVRPGGLLIFGHEKESLLINLWTALNRWLYASPDQVNFPSDWLKNFYESHDFFPASERQVVRNFKIKTEDLLKDKKNKNKKINFLFVGQIEEHKGIIFLIQTFYGLRVTDYELHIVGAGSKLKQAKQLASHNKNIIFHNYQPAEKFFVQADYTIAPSLCYENSPTIIFESLKAKVPVIASNLGGIPELIKNGLNGYLFAPVDKESLFNILKNVIIKANEQTR